MAITLMAVFSLSTRALESPAANLNSLLAMIAPASCSQYLVGPFPPHPDSHRFTLGRFSLGPLDRDRLVYWCRKVGCDYFERYPDHFRDRFAIEGVPVSVQLLDWPRLREAFGIPFSEVATIIVDHYFDLTSKHLRDSFHHEFQEAQEVFVAAGAPYIDLNQPLMWNGGTFLCVYQSIGKDRKGYFCPLNTGLSIDYAQADRRFPAVAEKLRDAFSFTGNDGSEIHKTLATYCRFVVKAIIHEDGHRQNEAFLHYVIALDLLFGEPEASNASISKRAAIVVSRALGMGFEDMVTQMKTIYGERSKYVHVGKPVSDNAIGAVRPVIDEVLYCLFRLQAVPDNKEQGFVEAWLRTLDYLVAATEAGKPISDQELQSVGITVCPRQ
jgi:hypothetical protein